MRPMFEHFILPIPTRKHAQDPAKLVECQDGNYTCKLLKVPLFKRLIAFCLNFTSSLSLSHVFSNELMIEHEHYIIKLTQRHPCVAFSSSFVIFLYIFLWLRTFAVSHFPFSLQSFCLLAPYFEIKFCKPIMKAKTKFGWYIAPFQVSMFEYVLFSKRFLLQYSYISLFFHIIN